MATNALELGVDIGGLDAVVLCGYPGTIASFWQQVGRAAARAGPVRAVLVAGEDQLDQWMMRHPEQLFARAAEPAVVNPRTRTCTCPTWRAPPTSAAAPRPTSSTGPISSTRGSATGAGERVRSGGAEGVAAVWPDEECPHHPPRGRALEGRVPHPVDR